MLYISFMFMGNLRFSYMPDRDFIVHEGYLPLLEILKKYPETRSDICSSGYTTLQLKEKYPEVIEGIKTGVAEGRISISTNGFEHVYLPMLSIFSQEKLIAKGVALDRSVYGRQPSGFWPSDCMWDSTVIKPLCENKVRWVYTGDLIQPSNPGGHLYNDWRDYDYFLPVYAQGPENAAIINIHSGTGNFDLLYPPLRNKTQLESLNLIKERAQSGKDGIFLFTIDLECLAALKCRQFNVKQAEKYLAQFIEELLAMKNSRFAFVDQFIDRHPPARTICLREGPNWGRGGWHSGSYKLDKTCEQAEQYLLELEDMLEAGPDPSALAIKDELEKLWERFFFSMQSEPRMTNEEYMWQSETNKCEGKGVVYPPDSMVLEAMNDAIFVLREARKLKQKIIGKIHEKYPRNE